MFPETIGTFAIWVVFLSFLSVFGISAVANAARALFLSSKKDSFPALYSAKMNQEIAKYAIYMMIKLPVLNTPKAMKLILLSNAFFAFFFNDFVRPLGPSTRCLDRASE